MNSPIYSEIVEKILKQAACPRCGAHLRDCGYETLEINEEHLIIELDCERCESVLTLEGIFRRKSKNEFPEVIVSPETVRGVGAALRSFKGNNISELLQK